MKTKMLIVTIFFVLGLLACAKKWNYSPNGFEYRFLEFKEGNLPKSGDIIYYTTHIEFEDRPTLQKEPKSTPQIFKMPDSKQLTQLENPVFDILAIMPVNSSCRIKYTKNPKKKYPSSYGDAPVIFIDVKVLDILDEKSHELKEQQDRETIIEGRKEYYMLGEKVVEKVKVHLNNLFNQPDTVIFTDGFQIPIIKLSGPMTLEQKTSHATEIKLSYAVFTEEGKSVFSSFENKEAYITSTNSLKIPPGWRFLIQRLNEGEEVIAFLPSELLYGQSGFQGNISIPPSSNLIVYFNVEKRFERDE
jgi:FKBP-type peptidyl-prolyl cis-trans isomerase